MVERIVPDSRSPGSRRGRLDGVDNDELICELSSPPLSSVSFATEQAGYEAPAARPPDERQEKREVA